MSESNKLLEMYGIRKTHRVHGTSTKSAVDAFSFPGPSGRKRIRIEVPPSKLTRSSELESLLLDRGAELPEDQGERKLLLWAFRNAKASRSRTRLSRSGWTAKRTRFSVAGRVIGSNTKDVMPYVGMDGKGTYASVNVAGTGAQWKNEVAALAVDSAIMMFMIGVVLAGPLLKIMKYACFSFNVFGVTRCGKSLAALVAASLLELSRQTDLMTWAMSDARLMERLKDFGDLALIVDDFQTSPGTAKERFRRIETLAYTISTGQDMQRHSSFAKGAANAEPVSTILLTNAEMSISALGTLTGAQRLGGAALRMIDIPAVYGSDDIFDQSPIELSPSERLEWRDKCMEALRVGCFAYHGAPFDAYVTALIADRRVIEKRVSKFLEAFARHVGEPSDTSIQRDVARKVGLPYAGVRLAARYGIVDWSAERILDAFTKCYRSAIELIPDEEKQKRQGQQALAAWLLTLPKLKNSERSSLPKAARNGYRLREAGREWAVVRIESFNRVFQTQTQRQQIIGWLVETGQIEMAAAKGLSPYPKEQAIWLDGKRRRSFKVEVFEA